MSDLHFRHFTAMAGPAAIVALTINLLLLWLYYGRGLPARTLDEGPAAVAHPGHRPLAVALVTLGVVVGFFLGYHLAYTTLAGVLVLMIAEHREPREVMTRVDWSLLVFFCSLFVVVAGLARTGLVEQAWRATAPGLDLSRPAGLALFSGLMTAGSNLVSNVPMVLLTGPHLRELGGGALGWVLLAYTTTIAGNLTLIGSVANLIVAERARETYSLGFWEYLRFGAVSTALTLLCGVTILAWVS